VQIDQDENGKMIIRFNPEVALLGVLGMKYSKGLIGKTKDITIKNIIKDAITSKKALIIDADMLKALYEDLNPKNAGIYSAMANKMFEEAVKEIKEPIIKTTAGAPGSGKSDILLQELTKDFKGIVADSPSSYYATTKSKIEIAKENGNGIETHLIIQDPKIAYRYTLRRDALQMAVEGKGRPVPAEYFAKKYAELPKTYEKLIKEYPKDLKVLAYDTRGIEDIEKAKKVVPIDNPKEVLDLLKKVEYTEDRVLTLIKDVKLTTQDKEYVQTKAKRILDATKNQGVERTSQEYIQEYRQEPGRGRILQGDKTYNGQPKLEVPIKPPTKAEGGFILTPEQEAIYQKAVMKEMGTAETFKKTYGKKLFRDIQGYGGLKIDTGLREEMSDIPKELFTEKGTTPDQIIAELNTAGYNFESGEDLIDAIREVKTAPERFKQGETTIQRVTKMAQSLRRIAEKADKTTAQQARKLQIEINKIIREGTVGRNVPPKQVINKVTGVIKPPPEKVLRTQEQLLRKEEVAAKRGYVQGYKESRAKMIDNMRSERADVGNVKSEIVDYVKEVLPVKERGRALVVIRNAKSQEDLIKAFVRIDRWAEDIQKKGVRNEILKTTKKAIESPAVSIDYKDKIKEAISEYELKGHTGETMRKLKATKDYITERLNVGEDVELPNRIVSALKILSRKPFKDITLSELEGLSVEIERLDQLGRHKWDTKQQLYNYEKETIAKEIESGTTPISKIPEINQR
jgi:hypothetical protein